MTTTSITHTHDGEAPHTHTGGGAESAGSLPEAAASASVAVDIGNGFGALVLLPAERFRGQEIEISRVDSDERTHTGVHERSMGTGSKLTAIFGSLPAGAYVVWEDASTAGPVVEVPDGAVTQISLD
jgi:hypothetical protein